MREKRTASDCGLDPLNSITTGGSTADALLLDQPAIAGLDQNQRLGAGDFEIGRAIALTERDRRAIVVGELDLRRLHPDIDFFRLRDADFARGFPISARFAGRRLKIRRVTREISRHIVGRPGFAPND